LDSVQNCFSHNRLAFGQEPTQDVIHQVQAFMLGGMQNLQVLLDRRAFRVACK
jgi:hypothetical protein